MTNDEDTALVVADPPVRLDLQAPLDLRDLREYLIFDALRSVAVAEISRGPSVSSGAWRALHDAIAELLGGAPAAQATPVGRPAVILPPGYRHPVPARGGAVPVRPDQPTDAELIEAARILPKPRGELLEAAVAARREPAAELEEPRALASVLQALRVVAHAETMGGTAASYSWRALHDIIAQALGDHALPSATPVLGRQPMVMPPQSRAAPPAAAVPVGAPGPVGDIRDRPDVAAELARLRGGAR